MKCYSPGQLPVLNALAREFAVFDRWFPSLPGPTWPNRFYAHAATSGGLDHSPSGSEIALWEALAGFRFEKGTLFDLPVWGSSLLIVTWDEHGGFYDHVAPPEAVSPGDAIVTSGASQFGFTFQQYGVRVPAVAVSPLIPPNLIDHRVYDHASIPATVERLFGLKPMTRRDAFANSVDTLATLATPRTDAPLTLPNPVAPASVAAMAAPMAAASSAAGPADTIDKGNLPGFLHAVLRTDLDLSTPDQRPAILARFKAIKTRAQAKQYMDEVQVKARAAGAAARHLVSRTKV